MDNNIIIDNYIVYLINNNKLEIIFNDDYLLE